MDPIDAILGQLTYSSLVLLSLLCLVLCWLHRDWSTRRLASPDEHPMSTVVVGGEPPKISCCQQLTDDRHPGGEHPASLKEPPGPRNLPGIGSLALISLGRYEVPYMAFGQLRRAYRSDVVRMRLGRLQCVVVNGFENIKEALVAKGHHFDSRPNFERYNRLFAGDKSNSLAFSDWSDTQKLRREMLKPHTFPRTFSPKFSVLSEIASEESALLVSRLRLAEGSRLEPKFLLLHTCANIFSRYFCSRSFEPAEPEFREMLVNFDRVFHEVNQGYAADFIPSLLGLHGRNLARLAHWSQRIRQFVLGSIVRARYESWPPGAHHQDDDYVDALIREVKAAGGELSWEQALFALEDIMGGHAAIGNLLVKVFTYLVNNRSAQELAQAQIDQLNLEEGRPLGLEHRKSLPYVEAIICETLRMIASPIVPHVANRNSSIAGYKVQKDDFIFLNNYDLNMSQDLWSDPHLFEPKRFIQDNRISKPEHFIPFGIGRRMCVGYKMVQTLSFAILANILREFTIVPTESQYYVPIGNLALPEKTFSFSFVRRR